MHWVSPQPLRSKDSSAAGAAAPLPHKTPPPCRLPPGKGPPARQMLLPPKAMLPASSPALLGPSLHCRGQGGRWPALPGETSILPWLGQHQPGAGITPAGPSPGLPLPRR